MSRTLDAARDKTLIRLKRQPVPFVSNHEIERKVNRLNFSPGAQYFPHAA